MDPNSWFYTLSAIPQTLAAMIALTATFIIYKLSRIKDYIAKHSEEVKIFLPHLVPEENIADPSSIFEDSVAKFLAVGLTKLDKNKENLGSQHFNHLSDLFAVIITTDHLHRTSNKDTIYEYLSNKNVTIHNLIEKKNSAYRALKKSLFFTSIPIVVSLFALPLYNIMYYRDYFLWAVLLFSCFSLIYTAYSVWKISNL